MTDYVADMREHRRLAILIFLERLSNFSSNASIITDMLNSPKVAVTSSRSQVGTELAWLAENGFVVLEGSGEFASATATPSGMDIARGRSMHPEIKRPTPRP